MTLRTSLHHGRYKIFGALRINDETGAKEGESIEAKASDGSTVRITVPAGTSPGATLHVRVPVALPPPVDPTVPVAQGTPVVTTTAEPAK